MSCSLWAYEPDKCDGEFCVGDCDLCDRRDYKVKYKELVQMIDDIYSKEDVQEVYDEIDIALEENKITWQEHALLNSIAYKVGKTAY